MDIKKGEVRLLFSTTEGGPDRYLYGKLTSLILHLFQNKLQIKAERHLFHDLFNNMFLKEVLYSLGKSNKIQHTLAKNRSVPP